MNEIRCGACCKKLGDNKARCIDTMRRSAERSGRPNAGSGYGGHFRAVQGFRYLGEPPCA